MRLVLPILLAVALPLFAANRPATAKLLRLPRVDHALANPIARIGTANPPSRARRRAGPVDGEALWHNEDQFAAADATALRDRRAPKNFFPIGIRMMPLAFLRQAGPPSPDENARSALALCHFWKLVGALMSDSAESSHAAAELRLIRDTHLAELSAPQPAAVLGFKPMQMPAGMIEAQIRAKKLAGMSTHDAHIWLMDHSVPYILDYQGRQRPVDRHHVIRAAWEAGHETMLSQPYFEPELHRLLSRLAEPQFYEVTFAMGLLYPFDQFGRGPHHPKHLPADVRSFPDDVYRSVSWAVRRMGGYEKTLVPFAEFLYANLLRSRRMTYPSAENFDRAVDEAMEIVTLPAAKKFPGYVGPE